MTPSPQIAPLTVASLIPVTGLPSAFDGGRGIKLVGAMGTRADDRFLYDSFGFPPPEVRNPLRSILSDSGSMLLVVADGEYEPRPRYVHPTEETTPSAATLLSSMADNRRIVGLAQLSAMSTPRPDLSTPGWTDSFNIVIGDSPADRILYWNARALMQPWRDGADVDLCIPPAQFDDPDFVAGLRDFLNRRNHVNGQGGSGPYQVTLRSLSLDETRLETIAAMMRGGQSWVLFQIQSVGGIGDCAPSAKALETADLIVGQPGLRPIRTWSETYVLGEPLRLSPPPPDHLRHAPTALLDQSIGAWAVDLDIERAVNHSRYINTAHRWRLPRRLRVADAFVGPYRLSGANGAFVSPRASRGGLLTVFTTANTALPNIALPSDELAIRMGLERGRDWRLLGGGSDEPAVEQLCYAARRSPAGRQFWGVYQLFGGISAAEAMLQNGFWRRQLEAFGATDQRTDVRRATLETQLVRRLGGRALDVADDRQLHVLAELILQEADSVRSTAPVRSWNDFDKDFEEVLARFNAQNPAPEGMNEAEELGMYRNGLREEVQRQCARGVLHQGYAHRCPRCLHRGWIGIGDLGVQIVCEVCHETAPAPVDKPWEFRLNGFLREGLQRHGVGPLFWVLSRMRQRNQSSFWFEGPLDIFFDEDSFERRRPQTDIDLTIIDNGRVRMCEVKQSGRQFRDPEGLATVMGRLRPDVAMIAVMEPPSLALSAKFATFAAALAGTGVEPELLTLDPDNDIDDAPYW